LRSRGDGWKNAIVVVLSDRGEGFHQHGEPEHGGVWKAQLNVALLVRIPGNTPARTDRLVSIADVVPTLMDLAEIPG